MSERIRSITVLFENPVSEEYIDLIENSLALYKKVIKVERDVDDPSKWGIEHKLRTELHEKLFEVIYPKK